MSSILTNNGAMVALQTMRNINRGMETTQAQISTGLKVGSAKDNAATWAISKVMDSDVAGFKAIKESLALGSSTVNVARNATETATKLLIEIKEKVVQAQESNVDRDKIQADIVQLRGQIDSVMQSAQFNGLNLVDGSNASIDILSSLNRSASDVTAGKIEVVAQNLTFEGFAAGSVSGVVTSNAATNITGPAADVPAAAGDDPNFYSARVNGRVFTVEVNNGDTDADVFAALQTSVQSVFSDISIAAGGEVSTTNTTMGYRIEMGNGSPGALQSLLTLDVGSAATDADRADALGDIENMIQAAIDASASFGSVQKRIEIQSDFVNGLMDSLKSGIGALVDADMEETSARLQALQVQQQLGIQALTIANQQPQNILALFR